MPSRLGVLLGTPGTSKTSISGVRCTKLEFYVEIVKIDNFRKIQRGMGKWATIFVVDFRRAILWGAYGGGPGTIGAPGSA